MSDDSQEVRTGYLSYSGMARSPMVWGIPFMAMLSVGSGSIFIAVFAGNLIGLAGWLLGLIGVPILLFIKQISTTDDKAVFILMLEAKWMLLKAFTGNKKYHGGAMKIAAVSYGRKVSDVKRVIKATTGR